MKARRSDISAFFSFFFLRIPLYFFFIFSVLFWRILILCFRRGGGGGAGMGIGMALFLFFFFFWGGGG
jgi:hypothetical protein